MNAGQKNDITQMSVPLRVAVALLGVIGGFVGSALLVSFYFGQTKKEIEAHFVKNDSAIEQLQKQDENQMRVLRVLPDRLTRLEMILCATGDQARAEACKMLPPPQAVAP